MDALDLLINHIRNQPSTEKGDILNRLNDLRRYLTVPPKKITVEVLKKYDILYADTLGLGPHYILVYKVTDTEVFGVVLSSKDKVHTLCPLEGDRVLQGGFATKLYMNFDLDICKTLFVRVYESKKHADKIFRLLKNYYKEQFKL